MENSKKNIYKMTLCAVFVALASVLSLVKVYKLPLGGSVTLLSMLPIVMLGVFLDIRWALAASFLYSLIQLGFGIAIDGIFAWGLTPLALIGTIFLDYIIPFTLIGLAGIFRKKGITGIVAGTVLVMILRFVCHLISGGIIFDIWCEWDNVWFYSFCYNGSFMLPELIITSIASGVVFALPSTQKLGTKING